MRYQDECQFSETLDCISCPRQFTELFSVVVYLFYGIAAVDPLSATNEFQN